MNNKILTFQEKPDFSGFLVDNFETYDLINWKGNKISFPEIQKVISFFVWQYETYKTESQLRLLRDKQGNFIFVPFYQFIETGLQSNEIRDSKENIELTEYYLKNNYHFFGSIHHHCSSRAFQSSTDYRDEININGFHFTIGNLDNNIFSLHGRFIFRGICYKINLLEIFNNLDFLNIENIPENIFPFEWQERLKEKPKPIIETTFKNDYKTEYKNEYQSSDIWETDNYFFDFEKELSDIEEIFSYSKIDAEYLYYLKLSDNQNKNRILELIDFLEYINSLNHIQENFEFIEFLENIEGCNSADLQKIKKLLETN
jgi:hypothetical protein